MVADAWDVIVVGSGAGGGMSAYVLTQAGLRVLMLEAGRDYDPVTETAMFQTPDKAPLRGASTPDKSQGYFDGSIGGWEIPDEPYAVAEGSDFRWYRTRMLGGRTNHWGRRSLRYGPDDFRGRSRDGLGADWPISYGDVEPWYDKVERLIGICGEQEHYENEPPSTFAQPAPPRRASERLLEHVFTSMGIPVAATRAAILTQPLGDRPACFYATSCLRGCAIKANFQSTTVLIPPALATGKLEIRTNCFVHEVRVGNDGRATGVAFLDRKTGAQHFVGARAVVLAASTCESARILLNSKSSRYPNGLSNDSGQVGRNLMDSPITAAIAQVPFLEGLPPRNDDGLSGAHIYVPWWGHRQQAEGKLDFPRGYHVEIAANRLMPDMQFSNLADYCDAPFGTALREEIRRKYGSVVLLAGFGEMVSNDSSYCEIDPSRKDRWGIPALRFSWKWGDPEIRQVRHMRQTFNEFFRRIGGKVTFGQETDGAKAISKGGEGIHEVGTARMGASPKDSVVNSFGQSWSVRNLVLADGSIFASSAHKNPTLTLLALAWRNSDRLAKQLQEGAL